MAAAALKAAMLATNREVGLLMEEAAKACEEFGVEYEMRVMSAHRSPDETAHFAQTAHQRGFRVIIAGAGGAAHLAGVIAGAALFRHDEKEDRGSRHLSQRIVERAQDLLDGTSSAVFLAEPDGTTFRATAATGIALVVAGRDRLNLIDLAPERTLNSLSADGRLAKEKLT